MALRPDHLNQRDRLSEQGVDVVVQPAWEWLQEV
jgi:hypothetical protein